MYMLLIHGVWSVVVCTCTMEIDTTSGDTKRDGDKSGPPKYGWGKESAVTSTLW